MEKNRKVTAKSALIMDVQMVAAPGLIVRGGMVSATYPEHTPNSNEPLWYRDGGSVATTSYANGAVEREMYRKRYPKQTWM